MLDRLTFGHFKALHDSRKTLATENAKQRILERQVEARRPGVALASRTAAQLVVDAPRFMALGADDVQSAGGDDLVVKELPVAAHLANAQIALGLRQRLVFPDHQDLRLDRAAQHDIGAAG